MNIRYKIRSKNMIKISFQKYISIFVDRNSRNDKEI